MKTCSLFTALNRLAQLGCNVTITDDWGEENCFTVFYEMPQPAKLSLPPALKPFEIYLDPNGDKKEMVSTSHQHVGHPGCTPEQGYNSLVLSLNHAANLVEKARAASA